MLRDQQQVTVTADGTLEVMGPQPYGQRTDWGGVGDGCGNSHNVYLEGTPLTA